jgi:hypothetical protein
MAKEVPSRLLLRTTMEWSLPIQAVRMFVCQRLLLIRMKKDAKILTVYKNNIFQPTDSTVRPGEAGCANEDFIRFPRPNRTWTSSVTTLVRDFWKAPRNSRRSSSELRMTTNYSRHPPTLWRNTSFSRIWWRQNPFGVSVREHVWCYGSRYAKLWRGYS